MYIAVVIPVIFVRLFPGDGGTACSRAAGSVALRHANRHLEGEDLWHEASAAEGWESKRSGDLVLL